MIVEMFTGDDCGDGCDVGGDHCGGDFYVKYR